MKWSWKTIRVWAATAFSRICLLSAAFLISSIPWFWGPDASIFRQSSMRTKKNRETKFDKFLNKITGGKAEKVLSAFVVAFSVILAVAIFVVLPYFITSLFKAYVRSSILMTIIEGCIRILIFLLYVVGISAMKDIKRLYMYHGAEHKCINCIERGKPLTVRNVMRSSRLHKRCGTSFMFFVLFISIILFFFIQVSNPVLKIVLRILLIPVIASISYEIIRLAGRSDNIFIKILSAPGMAIEADHQGAHKGYGGSGYCFRRGSV